MVGKQEQEIAHQCRRIRQFDDLQQQFTFAFTGDWASEDTHYVWFRECVRKVASADATGSRFVELPRARRAPVHSDVQ